MKHLKTADGKFISPTGKRHSAQRLARFTEGLPWVNESKTKNHSLAKRGELASILESYLRLIIHLCTRDRFAKSDGVNKICDYPGLTPFSEYLGKPWNTIFRPLPETPISYPQPSTFHFQPFINTQLATFNHLQICTYALLTLLQI